MVTTRTEQDLEPPPDHRGEQTERAGKQTKNYRSKHVKYLILTLFIPVFVSCSTVLLRQPPARGNQAEIQVYLQPVPAEADRVRWTMDEIAVIRSDGTTVPLTLQVREFKGASLENRQILIASGFLPPGACSGIRLTIGKAYLNREDGEAALLVPEAPLTVYSPYDLEQSEILTLFLSLKPSGLVRDGVVFSPELTLALPARELQSLTGYVSMKEADRIMVFNRQTLQITGAVATGRVPLDLLADPARERLYVALSGDDAVQVVDYSQNGISERIQLRIGDGPRALALTGNGAVLLSANYTSDTVSLIDPILGVEMERIEVGHGPTSVLVSGNNNRAYVTCSLSDTVAVIDLTAGIVQATLSMEGATPIKAVFDREKENLFVVGRDSPDLIVVDPATLTVTGKVYIGMGATSITEDDLSGLLLVGKGSSSEISIIDPSALMTVDFIQLRGAVGHMIVDPQERSLLVVLPEEKTIQKVDLVSKKVIAEMAVDMTPSEVAVFD